MRFQEREWAERAPAGALLSRPTLRRDGRARASPSEKDSIPGATERLGKKYFLFTFQTLFGKQSVQTAVGRKRAARRGNAGVRGRAGWGGGTRRKEAARGDVWGAVATREQGGAGGSAEALGAVGPHPGKGLNYSERGSPARGCGVSWERGGRGLWDPHWHPSPALGSQVARCSQPRVGSLLPPSEVPGASNGETREPQTPDP